MSAADPRHTGRRAEAIADLPALEATAVIALRLWTAGPEAQAALWSHYAATFGPVSGRERLRAFERLVRRTLGDALRPLCRHAPSCPCLGADESLFAGLVAAAAEGDRDRALGLALLLVRTEAATLLVAEAEPVGACLARLGQPANGCGTPRPSHRAPATRH